MMGTVKNFNLGRRKLSGTNLEKNLASRRLDLPQMVRI